MELNKSILLLLPLMCCSLISGIHAVPSLRLINTISEPPSAAPAPAPSSIDATATVANVVVTPSPPSAGLEELCKDADEPTLCVDTIAPFIKGALDPVVAVKVGMAATMNMTMKVSDTIKTLMASPGNGDYDQQALEICADQYSSIVDTINDCFESIRQNDIYGTWINFSSVLSYQQACEDSFREGGSPIPFKDDSKTLFLLGGNCLAILMHLSGY